MNFIIFWIIGWVIVSIAYYIWKMHDNKYYGERFPQCKVRKRLITYRALWIGAMSWFGIFVAVASIIVYYTMELNNWIESKLE